MANSCRECIHHWVCAVYAPTFDDVLVKGESCSEFKNKSNTVEVIRCGDCKWWIDQTCTNVNGAYRTYISNPKWFCCSGNKKE